MNFCHVLSRNSLILVCLLILLVVVVFIKRYSSPGKRHTLFASEPKREITRIEFSEKDKQVVLTLDAEGWKVNGKYEARKNAVLFMIRILTEIRIKSPVSEEMFEKEIVEKGIEPVKVKVFEKNKMLRSFIVFRTQGNKYGNIMKVRESAKPYIVSIPGYEGDIGTDFKADELYWRPFTIFNLRPSDISAISLENLSDTALSFRITRDRDNFLLSGDGRALSGWDTTRVRRYVSYFTWVPFESLAGDMASEEMNSIESQKPAYRLTVVSSDGVETSLKMWQRYIDGTLDNDRLWARKNGIDELLVIRYFDVDPLLKSITYFFPE